MEFDLSLAILALHTVVGLLFVALGILNLLAGRPLGLLLQGTMGLLLIGAGVAASRLVS